MKKNNKSPLVSVIIPVFNGASFLVEAVDSVQKSKYRNFEIILVDDGSTDNSHMVCRMLAEKYKNLHFYEFTQNKGLGTVLNFALKKARGTYICRLNQDDRMLPHRMGTQVAFLKKNTDVVAVGSHIRYFFDNRKEEILKFITDDAEIKKIWHIVSPFSDPSVMYRKDTALKAKGYDQSFWPADDTHLWYRMGSLGKLANIPEPLVEVRWHDKAASVFFFRNLAWSTYRMHIWAQKHIAPAPFIIRVYWIVQLISGLILPPQMNWNIYRVLKKVISAYEDIVSAKSLESVKSKRLWAFSS